MSSDAFKIQKSLIIKPRTTQPTLPEAGEQIYNSTTNRMQYYNGSAWIDVVASSASNGAFSNLITDGDAQSGVTNYIEGSYTAATRPAGTFTASSGAGLFAISTTTVTPINGTTSFLLTKSAGASRQGRAVERTIVLDREYQTKVLQMRVKFSVVSGTFVAGTTGTTATDSSAIFYIGQFNGTTWTYTEPSNFKTLSASTVVDYVSGSFQVNSDTTQVKLISYVAETASSAWVLECEFEITPSTYVYGSPITAFRDVASPPAITGSGGGSMTVGTGGGAVYTISYRQVGEMCEVEYKFRRGTTGFVDITGAVILPLPTGVTYHSSVGNSDTIGYGDFTVAATANPAARIIGKAYNGGIIIDISDSSLLNAAGIMASNANYMAFNKL